MPPCLRTAVWATRTRFTFILRLTAALVHADAGQHLANTSGSDVGNIAEVLKKFVNAVNERAILG